ncbi:hypothetical protein NAEGRDRAFT_69068 [Naegleria gruberi]|uniref:Oxidized purine nucleoside triphosphate hydrolase n=1 Tax=Naegleria gruberi TaxID=5762 RepID=D2VJK2_NAEGR|nr:uncharacterized protein NAEGRDRAFT_69068 [Naegleria gruberi]EFC42960.1 hypothetical protein NAEGRDRAFT_69068 [Naegleria gruberi]|eukprot:XP_002675704.1 hypothetical protein NAEGRDRAFT_69068 [Naegleria gruberi strain NEG-M]
MSKFFNADLLSKKKIKPLTLVFIQQQEKRKLLLGLKKRGFGMNKFNGFGGKVEAQDLSIKHAAERELMEEAGICATNLIKRGLIIFEFDPHIESSVLEVHVYSSPDYTGEITESEEMKPEWFDFQGIPYEKMWVDDAIWFPLLLENPTQLFKGHFIFSDFSNIQEYELVKVESLDEIGSFVLKE